MNYYQRHIGDYVRDAGHLTMIEHGVYTLLLDKYYATEKPIPNNSDLYKSFRAKSKEEKSAIDYVLTNFFVLKKNFWVNKRAEEEIKKMRKKIRLAKENGINGGRPRSKKNEEKYVTSSKANNLEEESVTYRKPSRLFVGSEKKPIGFQNETGSKAHQTPITNNQTPIIKRKKIIKKENDEKNDLINFSEEIFVALKHQGFRLTKTSQTKISNLLQKGASIDDFVFASKIAKKTNKGLPYLFEIVDKNYKDSYPKTTNCASKNIANGVNDDGSF